MNSPENTLYHSSQKIASKADNHTFLVNFRSKNERKLVKAFLLASLHQLFSEIVLSKIQSSEWDSSLECYEMDNKIIQFFIHGILETGEYTLEGISYYTHIPFDVIYEAAYGICKQFSITPWARVVDLYIRVKPDMEQVFIEKLLEIKSKNFSGLSSLLIET